MIRNADLTDALNVENHRNLSNTNRRSYNCGGYALGTFSWYVPCEAPEFDLWSMFDDFVSDLDDEDYEVAYFYLEKMAKRNLEKDFAHRHLHFINNVKDKKENEMVVAFRFGLTDFHFIKMGENGVWYQKCGGSKEIEIVPKEEVFGSVWRNFTQVYDSNLILMALDKES